MSFRPHAGMKDGCCIAANGDEASIIIRVCRVVEATALELSW